MIDRDKIPFPGTPEAVNIGCNCCPADGESYASRQYAGWITKFCPVHSGDMPDSRGKGLSRHD